MGKLIVSHDVQEFFRGEVVAARQDLRLQLAEPTEFYLVQLLSDYSRRQTTQQPTQEPLAFLYKRATESVADEKLQCYKNLGDVALWVAGYFADFIERSLVDVDYYVSMGGTAYSSLSKLVANKRHGGQFAALYAELATQFTDLVDVLNQVAARTGRKPRGDADLLRLYDRYHRTGSARLRRELLQRGLLPQPGVNPETMQ